MTTLSYLSKMADRIDAISKKKEQGFFKKLFGQKEIKLYRHSWKKYKLLMTGRYNARKGIVPEEK